MFKVLMALIFLGAGGMLAWLAATQENFCLFCGKKMDSSRSEQRMNSVQAMLVSDLGLAKKNNELPQGWDQISEVRYIYHSKKIQQVLNNEPILAINRKGGKKLAVEFFDEPGAEDIVMVRYSIVDIASGNTIGEMNRRLQFPGIASPPQKTKEIPVDPKKK